ncbi:MAG: translocation and assembly module TamA [Psychromonas sp.]|jgi:translocation and assembly module TamA|uniref:autotransporter assembly complex protein TamA n=1 Tax=Psychromonas sp. TaxID=1884585 RepID=UPI0039E4279B
MNIFKLVFLLLIIFFHATVMAKIKFDINGVDSAANANVSVFLAGLNEPRDAQSDSYLTQVEDSTREALTALGYYQVEIKLAVSGEIGKQTVILTITPGVQTRITELSIKLTGEGSKDPEFKKLLDKFPLQLNDVLNHAQYETAKSSLKSLARKRGYFDAKYEKSLVEVTSENSNAVVYLWFNSGVRYQFGELIFDTDIPAEKFVRSLQNFTAGDPFSTLILSKFNADINETGYFKSITLLPAVKEKQGLKIPLHVVATMRPEDSFSVGLGFSTDQGVRGKFRWMRPWVNDYGHAIEGNLIASVPKQEVALTYKIPLEDALYDYLSIQTGYKRVDQNDTNTQQYLVSVNRHWRLSNTWLRTVFLKYDLESGRQGQEDFSTQLIIPGISFSHTRNRGGINAYWGDKQLISLEAANQIWFASDDLVKVYGQSKFLRSYNRHQFIVSAELGAIYTGSIDNVPSSMRFFTGGDQSVRGYDYESIAPNDDQGYLVGGLYLAVASLEYRFPVSENWRVAVFADAGTATDDFSEDISIGSGIGAVWSSPVGPIRIYLAKPFVNATNSIALHFMIGPEL